MEIITVGRTGLQVTRLCLGAMTFGRESTEDESRAMLDRYIDAGGNFIDTADAYTQGASEEILGRWMQGRRRHDLVIATKVRFGTRDGLNERGLSRKHILDAVHASLKRLGTDYIDLYQVHMWDPRTPLEETLSTLDQLVRDGRVRYLGVSNFAAWQLQKALDLAGHRGWEPFTCLQPLYNLLDRELEWELLPLCRDAGLGVIPWSPLRGGWLSGKFKRGQTAPVSGSRIELAEERGWSESWSMYNTEHTWQVVDAVQAVADETGHSAAQVSLRWLLEQPGVTAPIIGARTLAQLDDNLGADGWSLAPEQLKRLNQASARPWPYPYGFIRNLA